MKIEIIGCGYISDKLVENCPHSFDVGQVSFRKLKCNINLQDEVYQRCVAADVIAYVAYDHKDILANLRQLYKLIKYLTARGWRGSFIFFNTQTVIANDIFKNLKYKKPFFGVDQYSLTKRIQTWFLAKYSTKLRIYHLYLPVVIGELSNADKWFATIAKHNFINLPTKGGNYFAYLQVDSFAKWFCTTYVYEIVSNPFAEDLKKLFVYRNLMTFAEAITFMRKKLFTINNIECNEAHVMFYSCMYKYRFSNNWRINLLFMIKVSHVALVVRLLRTLLFPPDRQNSDSCNSISCVELSNEIYKPIGPDYQYFSSSIDLKKIPFKKIII